MLSAGFAQTLITPSCPMVMGGYRRRRSDSEGVHDDLRATCVVIHDGEQPVAIFSLDLIFLDPPDALAVKLRICSENPSLAPERILLACTHTHSGPDSSFVSGGGEPVRNYLVQLQQDLARLASDALSDLQDVRFSVLEATVEGISFNRRLRLQDGSVKLNLESVDPNLVQSTGPVDRSVRVLFLEQGDKVLGCLVNFALHPTVLNEENRLVSRDFPGYLVDWLEDKLPGSPQVMFVNGALGDINQIETPGRWKATFEEAERIGHAIAQAVYLGFDRRTPLEQPTLSCRRSELKVARRYDAEHLAALQNKASINELGVSPRVVPNQDITDEEYKQCLIQEIDDLNKLPSEAVVEIQQICLGEVEFIATPGELFAELANQIREKSPYSHCFVFGNVNGYVGYIPTLEAFSEGAYETRLAKTSQLVPEAGNEILESILQLRDKS